ncbi:hypothetical protein AB0D24_03245 [Streptomyces javensis]|uniref:hypothetical protein n=1 Tax=Streptomyces javensis TaxID=114698 RepID=UPI00340ACDAD
MSSPFSHRTDSGTDRKTEPRTAAKRRGRRAAPPRRTLPSYRANPLQQINILLGLADLDTGTGPVQRAVLAQHVGIGVATVGDCMTFLADIGLVEAGRGQYAITRQGRAFTETWRCDRTQARLVLRPLLGTHWSAAAAAYHLADGPLPQEELARLLRAGLPGVPMRGHYMVEWLDIALIVERDEQRLEVCLTAPDAPKPPHAPSPKGDEERTQERSEQTSNSDATADTKAHSVASTVVLLGMTRPEIQELPDARYAAFLEGILQTLRGALAPTT